MNINNTCKTCTQYACKIISVKYVRGISMYPIYMKEGGQRTAPETTLFASESVFGADDGCSIVKGLHQYYLWLCGNRTGTVLPLRAKAFLWKVREVSSLVRRG